MENMENFICSSESCVELVQEGLTRSTKELYDIIGRGIATSIERVVRDRFFQSNFYYREKNLYIYLFDEINPEKITEFLMSTYEYSTEKEAVYGLVCRIQQNVFCKHFLDKVAKHFWTLLQVQIGKSCKASTGSYPASRIAIADHI